MKNEKPINLITYALLLQALAINYHATEGLQQASKHSCTNVFSTRVPLFAAMKHRNGKSTARPSTYFRVASAEAASLLEVPRFASKSFLNKIGHSIKLNRLIQLWWSFPLLLTAFPFYSAVTQGTYATMPQFWPVLSMEGIFPSFFGWIVTAFLTSNLCLGHSYGRTSLEDFEYLELGSRCQD